MLIQQAQKTDAVAQRAGGMEQILTNPDYLADYTDRFFTEVVPVDIDGDVPENIAKFANHSCEENCEAILEGDQVWITAKRNILTGEELTFDYRFPLRDFLYHPCRCGKSTCCGYIVAKEERPKLKKILMRQAPHKYRIKTVK